MIAVQTVRLETSPIEAIQTNFGSIMANSNGNYNLIFIKGNFGLD